MTDLAKQIRDYVEFTAPAMEAEDVTIERSPLVVSRPPWPRHVLATAVGAAALVIVVVGGAIIALRSTGQGGPAAAPTTPTTTMPAPTPDTPIPPPTAVAWADAGVDAFGQYFYGVAVGGPGLVAVGAQCDTITYGDDQHWRIYNPPMDIDEDEEVEPGCHWNEPRPENGSWSAMVWTSVDGVSWEPVPLDEQVFGGPEDVVMVDVVAGGPGLVAVGEADASWVASTAVIWTSVDGLTWQRLEDAEGAFDGESRIDAITAGGPGLVAVGVLDSHAAAWTSPDGFTWTRAAVDHGSDVGTTKMHDVTVGGPGLVAVGVDYAAEAPLTPDGAFPEGAVWRAAVWTSVDGTEWIRVPHDEQVFGGYPRERIDTFTVVDGTLSMWGVTATDDGLVAAGWSPLERAAWFSPDGLTWTRIEEHDDAWGAIGIGQNGPTEAIVTDGTRFAGVGWDPTAEYFQTHEQWRHDPAGPWGEAMTDAVVFGDQLIAVGYVNTHTAGAIWIGTWDDQP